MSFTTLVAAGVDLLDTYDPKWFEKINTETLDMSNEDDCILGQLFGDYSRGLDELGIYGPDYGLDLILADDYLVNWAELEILWLAAINERRRLTSI